MQPIRIASGPPSIKRKWNQLSQFLRTFTKVIPIKKDLSWLHFNDELMVQERQQMKDQKSCIFAFIAALAVPSSTPAVFHTWAYGSFIEIQTNLRRKKLHRTN